MLYYIAALPIMQDFRDNEEKTIKNGRESATLDFISAKLVMGYLCVRPYIMFYIHGPLSCIVFGLRKYHTIIQNCFLTIVNQVIG